MCYSFPPVDSPVAQPRLNPSRPTQKKSQYVFDSDSDDPFAGGGKGDSGDDSGSDFGPPKTKKKAAGGGGTKRTRIAVESDDDYAPE